ncbi:polysaccharide deacetylase family protein [Halobacteriales archaeon Cl-PHB]
MSEDGRRWSRRRLLASTALVATAGCLGTGAGGGDEPTPTARSPTPTGTPTAVDGLGRFGNLDNWIAADGRVTADESTSHSGSHSIHLTADESLNRAMATYQVPGRADLTDMYPSLAYRYGPNTPSGKLVVWLAAPDVDNRLVYERRGRPGNGWIETPLSAPDAVVGEPDLSDVRAVTVHDYTGGGDRVNIWLDGMSVHERPDTATVVFTFDDGHRSVAETAQPILQDHGYAGSVAAIPGRASRASRLSVDQLSALAADGWDVMSHPQKSDPLPAFDRATQEQFIADSKTWLEARGFERGARFFVYPYNRWDRTTRDIVADYHELAFVDFGATTCDPPMPALTSRIRGDDPAAVMPYLERLPTYGGVVVLMYHAVGSGSDWISTPGFRDVVSTVSDSGLDVATVGDLYDQQCRT